VLLPNLQDALETTTVTGGDFKKVFLGAKGGPLYERLTGGWVIALAMRTKFGGRWLTFRNPSVMYFLKAQCLPVLLVALVSQDLGCSSVHSKKVQPLYISSALQAYRAVKIDFFAK
jgi:hypothetical protein